MQHTYLRYECADAVGLACDTSSLVTSQSVGPSSNSHVWSTAGSQVIRWSPRQSLPMEKVFPYDPSPIGTGMALHSDRVTCLVEHHRRVLVDTDQTITTTTSLLATGWNDGTIRIFDTTNTTTTNNNNNNKTTRRSAVHHSLLNNSRDSVQNAPLTLKGHTRPVHCLTFSSSGMLLASACRDIVVWDIVEETGLFRLLGHTNTVSSLSFVHVNAAAATTSRDQEEERQHLVSTSWDGLCKVWDLQQQCSVQTIPAASGPIGAGHVVTLVDKDREKDNNDETTTTRMGSSSRTRLAIGNANGQVSVWSLHKPLRDTTTTTMIERNNNNKSVDDVCHYMGTLVMPETLVAASSFSEKVISCQFHHCPKTKSATAVVLLAVLHANSKTLSVYRMRTPNETKRKQQRRLQRRKQKQATKSNKNEALTKNKKKGLLDDDDDDDQQDATTTTTSTTTAVLDPETIHASDEFEFVELIRATHKIRSFCFLTTTNSGSKKGTVQIACALSTNALETHQLVLAATKKKTQQGSNSSRASLLDMYGHSTGIRSIALSSDDAVACTVSKNTTKFWRIDNRACLRSIPLSNNNHNQYCLCVAFLPGNTHVVIGTREGQLLIVEVASGDVVFSETDAHEGAIWSLDIRRPNQDTSMIVVVTGSADKSVKFWNVEQDEDENDENDANDTPQQPVLVHTRTLQMTDDVVAVRYSHSPTKRLVFAATLDSTIKVFFDDSLKLFLSLYGHKLPVLAMDASDDDVLLASSGADKTIKLWGLDFGDTHRTLHGHQDSVTDLRFVRRTHNFFTTSKDGTVRYWDGDRFQQILLLAGHTAEVQCLAMSRTGGFVLTGGMDRQMRIWERTRDMVFLDEERERELEQRLDAAAEERTTNEQGTATILRRHQDNNDNEEEEDDDEDAESRPQSEAAVKRSVLSVSGGDRIMEALERADQDMKDRAAFQKSTAGKDSTRQQRMPNPLLMGLDPAPYILWVLKTIRSANLEQSLLILPLAHVERLIYYIILLLKAGRGVELCSRVAIFLVKTHHRQLVATGSLSTPLRELRRLIRLRLSQSRDTIGYNLAALRAVAKVSQDQKSSFFIVPDDSKNIWAGMGLGSDLAAALEGQGNKNKRSRKR